MIKVLTRHPIVRSGVDFVLRLRVAFVAWMDRRHGTGILPYLVTGLLLAILSWYLFGTISNYQKVGAALPKEVDASVLEGFPSFAPMIWQSAGVLLALIAFGLCFLSGRSSTSLPRRRLLMVVVLAFSALAVLVAWLPTDMVVTMEGISGKALAGETPSFSAYFGKLVVVALLVLSIPVAAVVYFRLGLMDRYVVHTFLTPFFFCLGSFISIWVIADLTDNGQALAVFSFPDVIEFYLVQVPFVLLFVMPIAVLLAGLFALSKLSKTNELISMIGAGRSVTRVLAPLFVIGLYISFISLALKYEWAPASVGYKEAVMDTARKEVWVKQHGGQIRDDLWAKRGWMHVNEVEKRTWFVGRVPLRLSDEMADVVIWQLNEQGHPVEVYLAHRAKWIRDGESSRWELSSVRKYVYDESRIPRISSFPALVIDDWSETPWKVLSSSQNPEYLGVGGLTMYLNANADMDPVSLAPFRTNWWYIFAEPMICLALMLVAAPLGIVYSRRGSMAGVTGAIIIFAFMYLMRGTVLALGHRGALPPFLAAWSTSFVIAGIGLVLLWSKARNREIPKLSPRLRLLLSGKRKSAAPRPDHSPAGSVAG